MSQCSNQLRALEYWDFIGFPVQHRFYEGPEVELLSAEITFWDPSVIQEPSNEEAGEGDPSMSALQGPS